MTAVNNSSQNSRVGNIPENAGDLSHLYCRAAERSSAAASKYQPEDDPEETQGARKKERRTPAEAQRHHRDNHWSDHRAHGCTAVEYAVRQHAVLGFQQPLRDFQRTRPIECLTRAEQKPARPHAAERARRSGEHSRAGPQAHREGEDQPRAQRIHDPTAKKLHGGVRITEGRDQFAETGFVRVKLGNDLFSR
jgi:hypothetical protein